MTTLQDICHLITDGKHGDCQNEDGSGFYFVSCKDVRDGKINYSGARQITEVDFLDTHKRTQLEVNDIVITNSGTIGRMALAPNAPETYRTTFQKSVAIVKPNREKVVPQWLYYSLLANREVLIARAGGTAQKNLLLRDMRAFNVKVPPLDTQRKIAAVLSAYDDLIENNTRRIQILEEMAQAIYRQWFVEFQYPPVGDTPGHEAVPLVDSGTELGEIPQGWEIMPLSEACNSIDDGDWIETKDQSGSDYRLLQISNIGFGRFRETGKFRYVTQETFDRLNCNEVVPGDILVARMPTPIGRAWLVTKTPWRMITAVDVAILRVNPELISNYYCVEHLNSPRVLHMSEVLATGTTRPRITRKNLSKISIAIPPKALLRQFDEFVSKTYELSHSLMKKNANLRATRDLLLPRLISGEVDVSGVEFPV